MSCMPRSNPLLRLTCAACAVVITSVIGLSIHALARHYEKGAEALASARPVVVAKAQPR